MNLNITKMAEQSYEVDKELMQAIEHMQAGDMQSFEVIYRQTQRFMLYKADKLLAAYFNKDSELKADLVQEAYVKIFQSIHTLKEPEKFYGWINMILVNTVYGYSRAHKKEVYDMEDEQGDSMVGDLNYTEETPEDYVIEQEKRDYINTALESLPLEQRCVVEQYYFSDMSVEEIARQMECSEGTIKSRLNYARKKIKNAIEEIERTKKIKLHSVFAIPVFLLLEKEEAFAGTFDMTMGQTVYERVCDKCIGIQKQTTGGTEMGTQDMNQNGSGQEFQSMEEAAKFAAEKSRDMAAAAQASVQASGGMASVSTSIWTTALGKIIVAIIITVVAVGTIWGGVYTYTKQEMPKPDDVPPVVQEEVSDAPEEFVENTVEDPIEDVAGEGIEAESQGNQEIRQDDVIVEKDEHVQSEPEQEAEESTEVYVETDPTKMTAKSVGELRLSYVDSHYISGAKGETPNHHYRATDIMSYNNGPSSVGNNDPEWKRHREEFEVDGKTVPLWFYEGKRSCSENIAWLTAGMSDWNDETRDEMCWGKYNTLPQDVKDIISPIMEELYETYFLSEAELRSKAKAVPEDGNREKDSMGRVIEGDDGGQVYYFENDKVIRLDARKKNVSWSMALPNEEKPDVMWECEHYISVETEDGSTEYYKLQIEGAYMYQLMYVDYYSGPEGRIYAAAHEFYDEMNNVLEMKVKVYKMES